MRESDVIFDDLSRHLDKYVDLLNEAYADIELSATLPNEVTRIDALYILGTYFFLEKLKEVVHEVNSRALYYMLVFQIESLEVPKPILKKVLNIILDNIEFGE